MTNASPATPTAPVIRQLRSGRDFATGDRLAAQMANFTYALVDEPTRTALLVDPAHAPLELVEGLARDGLELVGVVLTHHHADHAGGRLGNLPVAGVAELLERHDVPVHVQRAEVPWVARGAGLDEGALVPHDPGDTLRLGDHLLTLVHTPGHTPGSQCLLVDGAVLTGDTLFLDGCGRTDLPGGDPRALYDSLFHRLGALPGDTVVLAGHDYSAVRAATLAEVRATNPFLAALGEDAFLAGQGG